MTGSAQQEIERKYDVDDQTPFPDFSGLPGLTARGPLALELRAEYLDTAENALARARTALRRREGGHDAGWHVKADTPLGRFENQWPLGDAGGEVPAAVRAELDTRLGLGAARFEPIARLDTARTIMVLHDAEGRAVVEIADDRVSARDIRADLRRGWREWEAELLPDAPTGPAGEQLLDRVEAVLLAAGARPSASASKIGRALGR